MNSARIASRRLLAAALGLLALTLPARADVLVVDAAGGGEHTSLHEALAAAQDGDTLLLRPGNYTAPFQEFVITDRSLTLVADGSGDVQIGGLRVVQSVAGKRVVLRGLRADTFPQLAVGYGLHVQGGEVFAEDCSFKGRDGVVAPVNTAEVGVRVDSGHLVLARCTVEGGRGPDFAPFHGFPPFAGAAGLHVSAPARASVYGGTLTGGAGGNHSLGGVGEAGGPGLFATNGLLFLAGTTVSGGAGGSGAAPPGDPTDYAGGDAVHLDGACELQQLGVTLVPGAGGLIVGGGTGTAGDALDGPLSTVTTHPGPYRSYALSSPTGDGEPVQLDFDGEPGDLVGIFYGLTTATLPLPGKQGVFHLGVPLFGPVLLGPVGGPDGQLSLSVPLTALGLDPDGAVLIYEQVFVKPSSGPLLLGSPTTHVIVDDSL